MNIQQLKKEKQEKYNKLLTDCKVFWAFSNDQFAEGLKKTPLAEGEKLVSIGAGGYMPKSMVKPLDDGMKAIERDFKAAVKEHKQRKENILYELRNHEAFYTNDLEDTLSALGDSYTLEEIREVYNANRGK